MPRPSTLTDWQLESQWAGCVSSAHHRENGRFHPRIVDTARVIMTRVKTNVERLVANLRSGGYPFVEPERVHLPPRPDLAEQVRRFQELGKHVPLLLEMWWEVVGSVNLMGTHPGWPHAGYGFDTADVWDADPLVVDDPDLVRMYEDWQWNRDDIGPNYLNFISPFRIPIAPDAIIKAGYSGGSPYELSCDFPQVDTFVLNEPQCVSFVAYLRTAFEWGGFPGLRCYPDAPVELIEALKKDLIPF